ncbi:MlaD family protein [Legionella sp. W05-934-2]|jgi:ABC-type transporter Mla subunit MlaD|uniref:MlaD family protein n=1 Tax=Legionella sp. W05-934-2 TaxID=1198649 RepID=UPI003462189D
MQNERYHTVVGIFVVGALLIILMGTIYLYREYQRSQRQTFVMFFKGSLNGLVAGAPVTYRGVKIGEIRLIEITENTVANKVKLPVYVQFFVEKSFNFSQDPVSLLIKNGYVANVTKPNLLTGIAQIELIQVPDLPQVTIGSYRGYPLFPTRNSLEEYTTIDDALATAQKTLEDISQFFQSKLLKDTIQSTKAMTNSVDNLARDLNQNVPSLAKSAENSLNEIESAASSAKNLANYLSRNPESVIRGRK